jgi:mono/diheme cytochrome c family protein
MRRRYKFILAVSALIGVGGAIHLVLAPTVAQRIAAVHGAQHPYPGRSETDVFAALRKSYEDRIEPIFAAKCFDCHTDTHVPKNLPPGYGWIGWITTRVDKDIAEGLRGLDMGGGFPFGRGGALRSGSFTADMARLEATTLGNTMPPSTYRWAHPGSGLSEDEHLAIKSWLGDAQRTLGLRGKVASTVPEQVEAVLAARCEECHGSLGAGGFSHVTDLQRLVQKGPDNKQMVVPGDPAASPLLVSVLDGKMPKLPQVISDSEIKLLRTWIADGAATQADERRTLITDESLRRSVLVDLERIPAGDRSAMRYFSLANLYNAGQTAPLLSSYREALLFVLNSLSWAPQPGSIAAVADTQDTIFRVDIRAFGLTSDQLGIVEDSYPYVIETPETLRIIGQTRARVDILRADWFVRFATVAPLYPLLLGLPSQIGELERQLGIPDACASIRNSQVRRAGFAKSGVSAFNRVIERHDAKHGAYWLSYDFGRSEGTGDILDKPLGPATCLENDHFSQDGGEVIFSLPNGFFGYMLIDKDGQRLDTPAPKEIVLDRNTGDASVINAVSCMGCHRGGLIPKDDEVRANVVARRAKSAITAQFENSVLALYVPRENLGEAVDRDNARYLAALIRSGVSPMRERDPVRALVNRFEEPLNIRTAAAEFGLTPDQFQQRLDGEPSLGTFAADLISRGIPRRDFVANFSARVAALDLGTSRKPKAPPSERDRAPTEGAEALFREIAIVHDSEPDVPPVHDLHDSEPDVPPVRDLPDLPSPYSGTPSPPESLSNPAITGTSLVLSLCSHFSFTETQALAAEIATKTLAGQPVRPQIIFNTRFYHVVIGPFETRDEGQRLAAREFVHEGAVFQSMATWCPELGEQRDGYRLCIH